MKLGFVPQCQTFTYKGITREFQLDALDQEETIDLIFAIGKVFIFIPKNAVV